MKSFAVVPLLAAGVSALWPIPSKYTHGDGVLWINPHNKNVSIIYNGPKVSC